MGRGTRNATLDTPASLRGAPARRIGDWQELAWPDRGEIREADERAPRHIHSSSPSSQHPDWNEDRALCDTRRGVAVVFDGMGGQAGGERASEAAIAAAALNLPALPGREDLTGRLLWMEDTVAFAKALITDDGILHPHYANQDATAAAVCLTDSEEGPVAVTMSAGDSRVYRLRPDGGVQQLTVDQDYLGKNPADNPQVVKIRELLDSISTQEEVDALDPVASLAWHKRHRVTGSVTLNKQPRVDVHSVAPGDRLLVCSDGVHDNLTRQEIAQIAAQADTPEALVEAVRQAAEARAASDHVRAKPDDITVVALAV